ncbi:uncharacterized protein VTP21DRAFT_2603 [Calcarisporiella thermophila]|uniref:uncharacterized protein n=1 Tax=Calcarisporiella thermophila TaxID=911321 RepID=UPI00374213AA
MSAASSPTHSTPSAQEPLQQLPFPRRPSMHSSTSRPPSNPPRRIRSGSACGKRFSGTSEGLGDDRNGGEAGSKSAWLRQAPLRQKSHIAAKREPKSPPPLSFSPVSSPLSEEVRSLPSSSELDATQADEKEGKSAEPIANPLDIENSIKPAPRGPSPRVQHEPILRPTSLRVTKPRVPPVFTVGSSGDHHFSANRISAPAELEANDPRFASVRTPSPINGSPDSYASPRLRPHIRPPPPIPPSLSSSSPPPSQSLPPIPDHSMNSKTPSAPPPVPPMSPLRPRTYRSQNMVVHGPAWFKDMLRSSKAKERMEQGDDIEALRPSRAS